jgi:hypothetical protein
MLLSLLAASVTVTAAAAKGMPPNHPAANVIAKFSHQFRCPYANEWVTKGPKQAALDLGLLKNVTSFKTASSTANTKSVRGRRSLQDSATIAGSCSYTNTWTGQLDCLELRGDIWTEDSMQSRCASETDSTLTAGAPCTLPSSLGGWCTVVGENGAIEASPLALMGTMDCAQLENACTTFISGTFEAAAGCGGSSTSAPSSGGEETEETASPINTTVPDGSVSSEDVICMIAPGTLDNFFVSS